MTAALGVTVHLDPNGREIGVARRTIGTLPASVELPA